MLDLFQLAIDIRAGKVFGTWQLPDEDRHMVTHIFLPIALMADPNWLDDAQHVYEYLSEANERGINGYPSFMSCKKLTADECAEIKRHIDALAAAEHKVLEAVPE